ncbi:hypothetical protein ABIF79_010065 [Bradyrhizobium japonicum]
MAIPRMGNAVEAGQKFILSLDAHTYGVKKGYFGRLGSAQRKPYDAARITVHKNRQPRTGNPACVAVEYFELEKR